MPNKTLLDLMNTIALLSYDVTVILWTVIVINNVMTTRYISLVAGTSNVMTTTMATIICKFSMK